MTNRTRKNPTLGIGWEEPASNLAGAPKTTQQGTAQQEVISSLLSVFRLYDPDAPTFQIQVLPLELDQRVSAQSAKQCE